LRETQQSFDLVASYSPASVTLSIDGSAELAQIERVSAAYFPLLGATPAAGQFISEQHDDPRDPAPVVVISHRLWTSRFSSDAAAIGRTLRLNGVPLTVIGIASPGFTGLSGKSDLWVAATMSPAISYAEYLTTNQNFIPVVGRLRPDVSLEAARSELAVLGGVINRDLPSDPRNPNERVTGIAIPLNEARVPAQMRTSLLVLFGAVALLYLLACANVINLMLGRTAGRQREYAVRMALGSSARRLFGYVFGEGAALVIIGGALGIGLAWFLTRTMVLPANLWPTVFSVVAPFDTPAFSGVELTFGILLTLITLALVATLPALFARRGDVAAGLRFGGRSISGSALSLRHPTARGFIVGLEAALAVMLVVAAGLVVDSVRRMQRVDLGVEPERVLSFWIIPSEARVPPADAPAFISRVLDSIARAPGVASVTVDGGAPLAGSASSTLYIESRPMPAQGQAPLITRHYVGPDHFTTLGIRLVRGRVFSASDTASSPRVAVISESAARRFWPGEEPIGKRVWFGGGSNFDSPERSAEIVGIVSDVRYQPFDRSLNQASFYTPYKQFTYPARMVFVRTAADPMSVIAGVRRAVGSVDPELALQDVRPLTDVVSTSWARRRFDATLFAGFGIAGLLLAASGIFAVLAHSVESRRREFGIRIALGAHRGRVVRQVLREGMAFPIAGLSVGLVAAAWLTRVLQSLLFETTPQEPRVFAGVISVLLLASALACLAPAWRATRADPIEALRSE
jgi:putative ABC transport system permease protein